MSDLVIQEPWWDLTIGSQYFVPGVGHENHLIRNVFHSSVQESLESTWNPSCALQGSMAPPPYGQLHWFPIWTNLCRSIGFSVVSPPMWVSGSLCENKNSLFLTRTFYCQKLGYMTIGKMQPLRNKCPDWKLINSSLRGHFINSINSPRVELYPKYGYINIRIHMNGSGLHTPTSNNDVSGYSFDNTQKSWLHNKW